MYITLLQGSTGSEDQLPATRAAAAAAAALLSLFLHSVAWLSDTYPMTYTLTFCTIV
jgi:hypothetical protein